MKKILILAVLTIFSFSSVNAQDGVDKVVNQAKNGGFYLGANFGFSVINSSVINAIPGAQDVDDFGSFNFGFDAAYLFEVMENLEVGLLVGYTHYVADGEYTKVYYDDDDYPYSVTADFSDAAFVPISTSARYYFGDHRFFGGMDLGYAINVSGDDEVDGGLFLRPKFGFDLGPVTLIASYQRISGDADYKDTNGNTYYSLSGFSSFNFGAEFNFN